MQMKQFVLFLLYFNTFCYTQETEKADISYESVYIPIPTRGLLYPRESESREVRSLDGIWRFLKSKAKDPMQGVREQWFAHKLEKAGATIPMPVPASYNDIGVDKALRDHVGTVWYERHFIAPKRWAFGQRVWLRFGSVHYAAIVWLNGVEIVHHQFGHLPFEAEVSQHLKFGAENRLTVLCDNTLTNVTIPQGNVYEKQTNNGTKLWQSYTFDFLNYAGIHRSVHLYTTPIVYIEDVELFTELYDNGTGIISFNLSTNGYQSNSVELFDSKEFASTAPYYVNLQLRDKNDSIVAKHVVKQHALSGTLIVKHVKAWWPYLMHDQPGYLYNLELYLHALDNTLLDVYRLQVGIRSIKWNEKQLLINGKPVYMRGFGRHEDYDIRGKGLDNALLTRDYNLLKWIGANAYRTSHYPYSEEAMQFADEQGIMIIDECAGVNIENFSAKLLENHMSAVEQLIHRDRNHPSVVIWSIANEPRSSKPGADAYFKPLVNYTRTIRAGRPIMGALNTNPQQDKLSQFLDILGFNHYSGWYQDTGEVDLINKTVVDLAMEWHKHNNVPIIILEYGAGTMEGMHGLPSYAWTEDYQAELFAQHFKAFDVLRAQNWFIGEFLWNFADFKTSQKHDRVGGNKKGAFTRARQPKAAAYLLRQRYFTLAQHLDGATVPDNLYPYVLSTMLD